MTKNPLDKTAADVLAFIEASVKAKGYAPTFEEIAAHFSKKKPGGYTKHWARKVVARLASLGRVSVTPRVWRGIEVVKSTPKKRK